MTGSAQAWEAGACCLLPDRAGAASHACQAQQGRLAHMGLPDMFSARSITPTQDSPKSVSFTWPVLEMRRLSGFMSR